MGIKCILSGSYIPTDGTSDIPERTVEVNNGGVNGTAVVLLRSLLMNGAVVSEEGSLVGE